MGLLSSRQLAEWQVYYNLEPFGEEPAYWRAGVIASVFGNAFRKKGSRPFKPSDFMPAHPEPEKTTEEKNQAIIEVFKGISESNKKSSQGPPKKGKRKKSG